MTYRFLKQIAYILIYCVIFFLIGWGAYKIFIHRPSCFDKQQNQGEIGVDCGGPCVSCVITGVPEPKVLWKKFLPSTSKTSDLIIALQNSTAQYGADSIDYSVKFIGLDGRLIKEISGKSFILPSQIKYLVMPNIALLANEVSDIQFSINKINWRTINVDNALLATRGVQTRFSSGSDLGYITIEGKVINRGAAILDAVTINAVVYNKNNPPDPAAVGITNVYTLLSNEERYFIIIIPEQIPGAKKENIDLTNINISADANLFLYY